MDVRAKAPLAGRKSTNFTRRPTALAPWAGPGQKASIKWLVCKAYSNKPPANILDPYYKDHQDKDRLKPAVLHSLANAELYCMSMAALYQDPNYHNLNHWGIIQAMSRKGVFVSEPSDCSLTETVLIQDSPLKMSAHMAVIEAIMMLYVKEQVQPDRCTKLYHPNL